ncbi:MAG: hypothetical protein WB460_12935 [Candidatus Acidiferrales bacterium]
MCIRCKPLKQVQPGVNQGIPCAGYLLALVLLFGLAVAGCGGGSGSTGTVPPSVPTFTTIDAPGAGPEGTFALAINASGEIAGYFFDASNTIHGFLRDSAGTITTIDAPGARTQQGLGTEGLGINASGTIVGAWVDQGGVEHSFVRISDGTVTTFNPPGAFGSGAGAIDDTGKVAGGYIDGNGAHGFTRASDGTFTAFDIPGISASQVAIVIPGRIGSDGTVAGSYEDGGAVFHGFVRTSDGTVTVLDAPGAGTTAGLGTEILDMNTGGVMAGVIGVSPVGGHLASHSVMRAADGTYTTFDPPSAGPNGSLADGINDSGAIVGTYVDANLVRHGYLRNADGTFASFDVPGAAQLPVSAINLDTVPRRINATEAIAGLFSDPNGMRHGFVRK